VATKLLMPHFNRGELAFYEDFFPGLGSGLGEILHNALVHPSRVYDPLLGRSTSTGIRDGVAVEQFREEIYRYYQRLLLPMGLLALLRPTLLVIGLPMVVINVLSSLSYTHDAKYHYSSIIVVAVTLAAIEGCVALRAKAPQFASLAVVSVLGFAYAANSMWSPSPLNEEDHRSGVWARAWGDDAPAITAVKDDLLALVDDDDGVSATYGLITHLTHRTIAYEFPNPWWVTNWLDCGTAPQPDRVDTLVVDTSVLGDVVNGAFGLSPRGLFERLTDPEDGEFAIVAQESGIVIAERVRPPELTFDSPRPRCD
jgi:hypothetical protein